MKIGGGFGTIVDVTVEIITAPRRRSGRFRKKLNWAVMWDIYP
ncbi:MAG: hypothetical protein AB1487_05305 [Thermodesulfobacteriota bacterium]